MTCIVVSHTRRRTVVGLLFSTRSDQSRAAYIASMVECDILYQNYEYKYTLLTSKKQEEVGSEVSRYT